MHALCYGAATHYAVFQFNLLMSLPVKTCMEGTAECWRTCTFEKNANFVLYTEPNQMGVLLRCR